MINAHEPPELPIHGRPALGIFSEFHVRLQFHQRKNFLRHYVPGSVRVSRVGGA